MVDEVLKAVVDGGGVTWRRRIGALAPAGGGSAAWGARIGRGTAHRHRHRHRYQWQRLPRCLNHVISLSKRACRERVLPAHKTRAHATRVMDGDQPTNQLTVPPVPLNRCSACPRRRLMTISLTPRVAIWTRTAP